jgi:hypothetical protein
MDLSSIRSGRQLAPPRILIYGPEGIGKALAEDTPVLTPTGFVPIRDLEVGDMVIGKDGKSTRVLGVFPQGMKPVFRVTATDGSTTHCCNEHLWVTSTPEAPNPKARSLAEIRETLTRKVSGPNAGADGTYPIHRLPTMGPVEFQSLDGLRIHPYALGALLGDGCFMGASVIFHKPEKDVQERLASLLPSGDCATFYDDRIIIRKSELGQRPSLTMTAIREMGLWRKHSPEKFIPREYLFASVNERIELLRGLCDTDGHVNGLSGSGIEFATSSAQLCDDVLFLVRSLGGIARTTTRTPHYNYRGEIREGHEAHRIYFRFLNGIVPVSSKKHLARWSDNQTPRYRSIESIEPDGEAECICIKVEAEDGLFVIEDFLVTHNTSWAIAAPNPIAILTEDGLSALGTPTPHFPIARTYQEVLDAIGVLYTSEHPYETLVLDSVDWLEALIWAHVAKAANKTSIESFVFQKGYILALDRWREVLEGLDALRDQKKMAIILTAHSQVKRFDDPTSEPYDRYSLKLHKFAAPLVTEWVDVLGFATQELIVKREEVGFDKRASRALASGGRVLYLSRTPAFDSKSRYPMPKQIPLSWAAFASALSAPSTTTIADNATSSR